MLVLAQLPQCLYQYEWHPVLKWDTTMKNHISSKRKCLLQIYKLYLLSSALKRMKLKEAACRSLHIFKTHILLLFTVLAQRSWLVNILIRVPLALICRGLLQREKSVHLTPLHVAGQWPPVYWDQEYSGLTQQAYPLGLKDSPCYILATISRC